MSFLSWRGATGALTNLVREHVAGERSLLKPLFFSYEINSACNLRCDYCYLHDRSYGFSDRGLSFQEMQPVLARIKEATDFLILLGGEPYLHPDWARIVKAANDDHDLKVSVITNGMFLLKEPDLIPAFHNLIVSYDAARERQYPEQMKTVRAHVQAVRRVWPETSLIINLVTGAQEDSAQLCEIMRWFVDQGCLLHLNVDRYKELGAPIPRGVVDELDALAERSGQINMTPTTRAWLRDGKGAIPFCRPTLLPLIDPRARLIYPCCYFNEQHSGSLLDYRYEELLKISAKEFGRYPFERCESCYATAFLDAATSVRKPKEGWQLYQRRYNGEVRP